MYDRNDFDAHFVLSLGGKVNNNKRCAVLCTQVGKEARTLYMKDSQFNCVNHQKLAFLGPPNQMTS